jgi:transposase
MDKKRRLQAWELSDAFWRVAEPLIPQVQGDPTREYQRKAGAGRKPLPARQVFAGILFVLRTGIQWKALPKERFGSPSAIHRYFLHGHAAGFFQHLWQAGLMKYDEMQGIAWTWQSIDGSLSKAPFAQEAVGPNPTDRGKKWEHAQSAGGRTWHPRVARRQRRGNAGCVVAPRDRADPDFATRPGLVADAAISEWRSRGHGPDRVAGQSAAGVCPGLAATWQDDRTAPRASSSETTMGGRTWSWLAESLPETHDSL